AKASAGHPSLAVYHGTKRVVPDALQILTQYFSEGDLRSLINWHSPKSGVEKSRQAPTAAKRGGPVLGLQKLLAYAHDLASAIDFLHLQLKVSHDAVDAGCIFMCDNGQRVQLAGLGESSQSSEGRWARGGGVGAERGTGGEEAGGDRGSRVQEEEEAGGASPEEATEAGFALGHADRRALAFVVLEMLLGVGKVPGNSSPRFFADLASWGPWKEVWFGGALEECPDSKKEPQALSLIHSCSLVQTDFSGGVASHPFLRDARISKGR
ncbi:hypothetical protein T484DRAFT_1967668, partial [Baffinella frigidus]